jgi:conjugative relaxase-like TrwC/TraI family protein
MVSTSVVGVGIARYLASYVAQGGAEPSQWWGEGAKALGLKGEVDVERFENLLRGFSPDGRTPLVQHQSGMRDHRAGADFCFSPPRDLKALIATGDAKTQRHGMDALIESVTEVLTYAEKTLSLARWGKGGREHGPGKLVAVLSPHYTSRPVDGQMPDPQPHVHATIVGVTVRPDGRTASLVTPPLFREKRILDALFTASLASQLEQRIGVKIIREGTSFRIDGVPRELSKAFSKRRDQIEKAILAGSKRPVLDTRSPKKHVPLKELAAAWQETARQHGFGPERASGLLMRQEPRRDVAMRLETAIQAAVAREPKNERELLRFAAEESIGKGLPAWMIRHGVKDALRRPDLRPTLEIER